MKKVLFALCALALLAPASSAQPIKAFFKEVENVQQELKNGRITEMDFLVALNVEYQALREKDLQSAQLAGARLAVEKFEARDGRLFTVLEFIEQNRDVIVPQNEEILDFGEQLVEDFNAAQRSDSAAEQLFEETNGRFSP